jgi:hypothetical protein
VKYRENNNYEGAKFISDRLRKTAYIPATRADAEGLYDKLGDPRSYWFTIADTTKQCILEDALPEILNPFAWVLFGGPAVKLLTTYSTTAARLVAVYESIKLLPVSVLKVLKVGRFAESAAIKVASGVTMDVAIQTGLPSVIGTVNPVAGEFTNIVFSLFGGPVNTPKAKKIVEILRNTKFNMRAMELTAGNSAMLLEAVDNIPRDMLRALRAEGAEQIKRNVLKIDLGEGNIIHLKYQNSLKVPPTSYFRRWGYKFEKKAERIIADAPDIALKNKVREHEAAVLSKLPAKPAKPDLDKLGGELSERFAHTLPFGGYENVYKIPLEKSGIPMFENYLALFEDGPIKLSKLCVDGNLDCTGQALTIKLTLNDPEGWELYSAPLFDGYGNLVRNEDNSIKTRPHTLLAKRYTVNEGGQMTDYAVLIDPSEGTAMSKIYNDYGKGKYYVQPWETFTAQYPKAVLSEMPLYTGELFDESLPKYLQGSLSNKEVHSQIARYAMTAEIPVKKVETMTTILSEDGSSASVYYGVLADGKQAAIKILRDIPSIPAAQKVEYMKGELAAAKLLSDNGIGPKLLGVIANPELNIGYAMELVEGAHMEYLTPGDIANIDISRAEKTIDHFTEIMIKNGVDVADFQYMVATRPQTLGGIEREMGDIIIMDPGDFRINARQIDSDYKASMMKFAQFEKFNINAEVHVAKFLTFQDAQAVGIKSLLKSNSQDVNTFKLVGSRLIDVMSSGSKYDDAIVGLLKSLSSQECSFLKAEMLERLNFKILSPDEELNLRIRVLEVIDKGSAINVK